MARIVVSPLGVLLWFGLLAVDAQTRSAANDPASEATIETRQKAILFTEHRGLAQTYGSGFRAHQQPWRVRKTGPDRSRDFHLTAGTLV